MRLAILPRYLDMKRENFPSNKKLYVNCDFDDIARTMGIGLCAILTPDDCEDVLALCDGLIIPGSPVGVNPAYYGKAPSPSEYDEYALDAKVLDYFVKNNKPVLGICAGHQAINIYFGGTIGYVGGDDPRRHSRTTHPVNFKKDSFLYDVFGVERKIINSYHVMHVDNLADCLETVAESDDGIIEAFKHKEKNIFGVQWHPERSFDEERELLEFFLKLCEK